MPAITHDWRCRECEEEITLAVRPPEPATRDDPGCPADVEPFECPNCGLEIDVGAVWESVEDRRAAQEEDAAESRREMDREDSRRVAEVLARSDD